MSHTDFAASCGETAANADTTNTNRSDTRKQGRCRNVAAILLLLAATFFIPACVEKSDTQDSDTTPPPEIPYRFQWSTDSSIDLFSREAELIRASVEASEMAFQYGLDHSFPGYRAAISGPRNPVDEEADHLKIATRRQGTSPRPMSLIHHIVDFKAIDNTILANVCSYAIFPDEGNRMLNPLSDATHIVLELPAGGSRGLPGIRDQYSDKEDAAVSIPPDWNVFGDWQIRQNSLIPMSARTVIPESCLSWWQERFPEFEHRPETGFNVLYAPDGWEPPTLPLVTQYPEWIGPSKPE